MEYTGHFHFVETVFNQGVGIAQWLECWIHYQKVAGLSPCRSGARIFFSRVNFPCWLLFWYPFQPRVTAVACQRSWSFCEKCRWQVTAKHTYTLRMWLHIKWHCKLVHVCIVYTEPVLRWWQFHMAPAKQLPNSTVSTPLQLKKKFKDRKKSAVKKETVAHLESHWCKCSESAREQRVALYKSN